MSKSNLISDSTIPESRRVSLIRFLAEELRKFRAWAEEMGRSLDEAKDFNDVLACQAEIKLHHAETVWKDFYENVKCMLLDHERTGVCSVFDIHTQFSKGSALINSYLKVMKEQKEKKISLVEWHTQKIEYMSMML
ncbi:hypothetical protein TKK_0002420 [Trichogramma kaykai]